MAGIVSFAFEALKIWDNLQCLQCATVDQQNKRINNKTMQYLRHKNDGDTSYQRPVKIQLRKGGDLLQEL